MDVTRTGERAGRARSTPWPRTRALPGERPWTLCATTATFLLGYSLGGTVAPRIATRERSIAGLIILAGGAQPLQGAIPHRSVDFASGCVDRGARGGAFGTAVLTGSSQNSVDRRNRTNIE